MNGAEVPILIPHKATGSDFLRDLPAPSKNIFQRIIRNPRAESPYARERECTEMLASVLINAPILREHIFRWMAGPSELDLDLEFAIGTERSIGAKRPDLWIEGRKGDGSDERLVLHWIVEVKVGSSFHESAAHTLDDEGELVDNDLDKALDEQLVHQLKHYDDWLAIQRAEDCRGFVLALRDLSSKLPALNLKRTWPCLSWTRLGLEVNVAIERYDLPPQEALLARHLLGFISENLWRIDEMPGSKLKLDFNDIALIRAFSKIGRECERKVNELMSGAISLVEKSGIGFGEVKLYERLYKGDSCSCIERFLVPRFARDADPALEIAIGYEESYGDYLAIWINMSPTHPQIAPVRKAIESPLKKLQPMGWRSRGSDEADEILQLLGPDQK
jgi:hypothetical protein